ncbi:MAG: hypothetical protein AAF629_04955 [Chloroflexota bacterium]
MKIRKLQRQNENQEWIDDTYACKDEAGKVVFRYNSTWGRIGSFYNILLKKQPISLDEIETVISPTKGWRWLPIEVIEDHQVGHYLTQLDESCAIYPNSSPLMDAPPSGNKPD